MLILECTLFLVWTIFGNLREVGGILKMKGTLYRQSEVLYNKEFTDGIREKRVARTWCVDENKPSSVSSAVICSKQFQFFKL